MLDVPFGVLEENDQVAFSKYWSFAMLGLSLGGVGVFGFAGDAMQAQRALRIGAALDFVKAAPARGLASARMAIVAVKSAKFGKLVVSYAPLPSGRIVMKINDVGRVVAPAWESLPRLRLRMNTTRNVSRFSKNLDAAKSGARRRIVALSTNQMNELGRLGSKIVQKKCPMVGS